MSQKIREALNQLYEEDNLKWKLNMDSMTTSDYRDVRDYCVNQAHTAILDCFVEMVGEMKLIGESRKEDYDWDYDRGHNQAKQEILDRIEGER